MTEKLSHNSSFFFMNNPITVFKTSCVVRCFFFIIVLYLVSTVCFCMGGESPTGSISQDTLIALKSLSNLEFNTPEQAIQFRQAVAELGDDLKMTTSIPVNQLEIQEIISLLKKISITLESVNSNTQKDSFIITLCKENLIAAVKVFVSLIAKSK